MCILVYLVCIEGVRELCVACVLYAYGCLLCVCVIRIRCLYYDVYLMCIQCFCVHSVCMSIATIVCSTRYHCSHPFVRSVLSVFHDLCQCRQPTQTRPAYCLDSQSSFTVRTKHVDFEGVSDVCDLFRKRRNSNEMEAFALVC